MDPEHYNQTESKTDLIVLVLNLFPRGSKYNHKIQFRNLGAQAKANNCLTGMRTES